MNVCIFIRIYVFTYVYISLCTYLYGDIGMFERELNM